ncbi:MAG: ATP phosphoribosyltransferase [Thermoanaerobaculales bacterium]|jgi:ATP phosphoribosyltransferase|nr:ATP phosphoribosyltransferase [Thermoanaerobaculales bacterium]
MTRRPDDDILQLAIPKGRMYDGVVRLLAEAGVDLRQTVRSYRPHVSLPACEVKVLKPQSIVEMLHAGSRDVGFAGADWVAELDGDLVELVDTGLDPVRVVAAAPATLIPDGALPGGPLVVASEYERLSRRWIAERGLAASFVRSYGATEVFPPEDADLIIDNTATGSTLEANNLVEIDELMTSSTRLYANPDALRHPERRVAIDALVLLVRSVLEARRRVMVEVNVTPDTLEAVLAVLPCMRRPTVAELAGGGGFAVKAAVPRSDLPAVIPRLKAAGGADVVVTRLAQIVP